MVYEKGKNFNEISPTSSDSIIFKYNHQGMFGNGQGAPIVM